MKRISLARASRSLAQYAADLNDEIIVVTEGQSPIAALVPLKNVDRESLALSTHPEFMKLIAGSRRRFAAEKTLDFEDVSRLVSQMGPPKPIRRTAGAGQVSDQPVGKRRAARR